MIDARSKPRRRMVVPLVSGGLLLAALALVIARRERTAPSPPTPRSSPPADVFTAIPADTVPIAWHEWSDATFATARRRGVAVAVLFDASWCESCVLYAGALALHPGVRARLERDVIAVRADIDQRPDLNARFRDDRYALPTWVLLSPEGAVWDIADAPHPASLERWLSEWIASPRAARPDPGVRALQPPPRPPSPHLDDHPDRILADLAAAWPAADAPLESTTPLLDGEALAFLAARARTGDAVSRAFFLEAARRLASAPFFASGRISQDFEPVPGRVQRGSFLDTHALALEAFCAAFEMTRDSSFARAAVDVVRWTDATLFDADAGLYRGAQGTLVMHEGWPAVTAAERARLGGHAAALEAHRPDVYPTAGNARWAAAQFRWGTLRGDASAVARARGVVARLRDAAKPLPPHDWTRGPSDLGASPLHLSRDAAELGLALLESGAGVAAARDLAAALLGSYVAPNGAFTDVARPDSATERTRIRMTPLADNARTARFLAALGAATGDPRYAQAARRALEAWSLAVRSESPWAAAGFAAAVLALPRDSGI